MTTDPTLARGRAFVRLIEAADLLLSTETDLEDLALLRRARLMASDRLHTLVADAPPAIAAQLLAARNDPAAPDEEIELN